jgi:hypothetical protein
MFPLNFVFLAQSPTSSAVATNTALENYNKSVPAIKKTFDSVWTIAMDGNLYKLVCTVGTMIAIFAIGFWCVKFYLALEEGSYKPVVNEMIFPLIVVMLLSNSGANMRGLTITTRDIMSGVNDSINQVVGLDIDMRQAIETLAINQVAKNSLVEMFESCNTKYNTNEFAICVNSRKEIAEQLVAKVKADTQNIGSETFRAQIRIWQADLEQTLTSYVRLKVPTAIPTTTVPNSTSSVVPQLGSNGIPFPTTLAPSPAASASSSPTSSASPSTTASTNPIASVVGSGSGVQNIDVFSEATYSNSASMQTINSTIISFRKSFLYIIEVMLVVTALIGPIFVALSMFPVGTKPMLAWATSFLSLGFCKICFSLISGLSAIAFVYAGPKDLDMTVVAVVLGLLAPVLSFAIASGSGLNALSNVSQISQNFGLNTGAAYYTPGSGYPNGGNNSDSANQTRKIGS